MPSVDASFADRVRDMAGNKNDEEMVQAAKDVCFDLETSAKTEADLEAYIALFSVSDIVAPEHTIPFLVAAMKTYCPQMERLRPRQDAGA